MDTNKTPKEMLESLLDRIDDTMRHKEQLTDNTPDGKPIGKEGW